MSNVTALRKPVIAERWLSPEQVCELVPGMSLDVLQKRRSERKRPDYFKPTGGQRGVVLYAESEIHAWIASGRIVTRDA